MNELVDFCFQGGTHEQLSLAKYGAKWVSKNNRSGLRFTRSMVKDALEYLMENCYFTFGDKVFRQVIGIPMGSDPAPFMANLFLYYYENTLDNYHVEYSFNPTVDVISGRLYYSLFAILSKRYT